MSEVRFHGVMPLPPAEVFDFLADARNWPDFFPGVVAVDRVDGWGTPGGRCRLTLRVLGRRRTLDCEMTEIERPRLFRYVAREEGQPTATNDCRFTRVTGGTRVEITARRLPRRGLLALYDRFLVPWALRRTLRRQMISTVNVLVARRAAGPDPT